MLRQNNCRRGFSLIAILTVVSIVVAGIVVTVPRFVLVHRSIPHELDGIRAIQNIHQAQVRFRSQFGRACMHAQGTLARQHRGGYSWRGDPRA